MILFIYIKKGRVMAGTLSLFKPDHHKIIMINDKMAHMQHQFSQEAKKTRIHCQRKPNNLSGESINGFNLHFLIANR